MGFQLTKKAMEQVWEKWAEAYDIYAPKVFVGGGMYSDTDCVRYGQVTGLEEVVFDQKAAYSFKESFLPNAQTLFYFSEDHVQESADTKKDILVFLRSCDIHAVKRLDAVYLENGVEDYYYRRLRDKVKFVLMGCESGFESCFCVDMKTNISENYDFGLNKQGDTFQLDCKVSDWNAVFAEVAEQELDVTPAYVTENKTRVNVPKNIPLSVIKSQFWDSYDARCIACGRCNFVCPTCTCFTMQDMYYTDNDNAGERRRVWASCMVDGYSDVAGGGSYRKKNGERMRFKVLHKVWDFKQRKGYHMCVGCGRCDDVCPEYISFSHCVNELDKVCQEVNGNDA